MLFALFTDKNRPFAVPPDLLRDNLTSAPRDVPISGSYYKGLRRPLCDLVKTFFSNDSPLNRYSPFRLPNSVF
jgi:hypothetical protein